MSEGFRDSMATALILKHTEMQAISPALIDSDLTGYVVVSEAEGVLMDATRLATGLRFDTMRSRAEHTPETVQLDVLP
jgi:hypothetical protein